MEEKIYPKILIIGQTFNKNQRRRYNYIKFFHGWPKDKIAVASTACSLQAIY